jgi:hypothetical protein
MVMPDTYFFGEQPYSFLANSVSPMDLACWPIRPEQLGKLGQVQISTPPEGAVLDCKDKDPQCGFGHSWGAMAFDRMVLSHASPDMPHTGFMIPKLIKEEVQVNARVMVGSYYDCGSPVEYLQMLVAANLVKSEFGDKLQ